MARLRDSWRTRLAASQQARNPQPESIARNPYQASCGCFRLGQVERTPDALARRSGHHLARGASLQCFTTVKDAETLSQSCSLIQIVRDQQDGHLQRGLPQLHEFAIQLAASAAVHSRKGLV